MVRTDKRWVLALAMPGVPALACAQGTVKIAGHPGVLEDVTFDQNGALDRESCTIRVGNGKPSVFAGVQPVAW